MTKILFVCHGNICRSPMAEFVLKDMVKKREMEHDFFISSAATSNEEIGNGVHHGTRRILKAHGISCDGKTAVRLTRQDYGKYDYIIGMDRENLWAMNRILGGDPQKKIHLLLEFAGESRDIADPWYTGNFDDTYRDVLAGCTGLLDTLTLSEE